MSDTAGTVHIELRRTGVLSSHFVVECGRCFALLTEERIEAHMGWHAGQALEHWGDREGGGGPLRGPMRVTWTIVEPGATPATPDPDSGNQEERDGG